MRNRCLLVALMCVFSSLTIATAGASDEDLRGYIAKIVNSWNSPDSEKVVPFYAADGECVSFGLLSLNCKTGEEHHSDILKPARKNSSQRMTMNDDLSVHRRGSIAWATFTWKLDYRGKDEAQHQLAGRWTMILEQRNNIWVVVHEHVSVPMSAFMRPPDSHQSSAAAPGASPQTTTDQAPKLALLSSQINQASSQMYTVEGEVQNITEISLQSIYVIVTWYTADSRFIRSDSALVQYNPILPRQISPFKVFSDINPEMSNYKIGFQENSGAGVLSVDRRSDPRTSLTQEASQPLPPATQVSALEGSIFLVTSGGDIKPARFAKMGVFSGDEKDLYETVGKIAESISAMRDSSDELQRNLAESECSIRLLKMWQASLESGKFDQETDEAGKFSFESVHPGTSTIMAFGKGGLNAALWISTVTVEGGKTAIVKMGKPAIACFDPESRVSF